MIDADPARRGGRLPGKDRLERNLRLKSRIDRLAAAAIAVLLAPILAAIALAIAAESLLAGEAPHLLVSEPRRSAGRTFRLLKFRVFRVRAWREHLASAPLVSIKAVEGVPANLTRVGRVLKACYLDELPQLFCILRGEMGLVGPRPYFEGDWLREGRLDIPARRTLKAGLLGPYQAVKGTVSGLEAVNQLDSEYLELLSSASAGRVLAKDLSLLARSVRTVLEARGL